jgi:hypothetical protein
MSSKSDGVHTNCYVETAEFSVPAFKKQFLQESSEGKEIFCRISDSHSFDYEKGYLKPIWTCEIQLWGTASTSNIEILERFQSKALRMIVDAPRYVPNTVIRRDLQTRTVKEEIRRYSSQYSARLSAHRNGQVVNLME